MQGIATMASSGMIEPGELDAVVEEAVAHFLRGARAPA
jgi:hypothetical protein